MRGGDGTPIVHHTLMPLHRNARFEPSLLKNAELAPPFAFTKSCPTFKIPKSAPARESLLFDLLTDPHQLSPLQNPGIEAEMVAHLQTLLRECDVPAEQWQRLRLQSI